MTARRGAVLTDPCRRARKNQGRNSHGSCETRDVRRILLVLRGEIDSELLVRRYRDLPPSPRDALVAICYQLPPGHDGLIESLNAQRALTTALRAAQGAEAEQVPVFVACERDGERLADCARAWGATEVLG